MVIADINYAETAPFFGRPDEGDDDKEPSENKKAGKRLTKAER